MLHKFTQAEILSRMHANSLKTGGGGLYTNHTENVLYPIGVRLSIPLGTSITN